MDKNVAFTREQVLTISLLGIIGNIVYIHTWIDDMTDRSAWLAAFLGILLLIPFAVWILYIGSQNQNCNIFDVIQMGFGKLPANAFRVVFILINIVLIITQLNMFTEMVHVYFLPFTPTLLVMLAALAICAVFVRKGIDALGRCFFVLGLLGVINYFACFILAFPKNVNMKFLIPVFDTTISGFIQGTLFITQVTSEYLLLLMILVGCVSSSLKYYKWVITGIILTGFIFTFAIAVIMAMMSPELAKRIAFGGVNASRLIQIGEFIHGLELLVFLTYQFIAFGKIMICIYCIWVCTKQIITVKRPNLQLFVIAAVLFILSVLLNSYIKAYFIAVFMGSYILPSFVILALISATICSFLKRKKMGMSAS